MTIKRFGLGRECAHGVGQPTIIERADGPYVHFEDYDALAKKLAIAESVIQLGEAIEAHRIKRDQEKVKLIVEILE